MSAAHPPSPRAPQRTKAPAFAAGAFLFDFRVQARNHRTTSIDYAVVISGEIDMEMDGTLVHLKAGDVLVQRGTIHNWINNGPDSCIIAFVLIDAKPATAGSKRLDAEG